MRSWTDVAACWEGQLTEALRTPNGTQRLRPAQVAALVELAQCRGAVLQGRVGIGKTLTLSLAPAMVGAQRPLIVAPGGILRETAEHTRKNREHWQIPVNIELLSYQAVSRFRTSGRSIEGLFGGLGPDFIGADEVHFLKNIGKSAVASLFQEYLEAHPECVFFGCSGTLDKHGLADYAPFLDWALRDASPLPRSPDDIEVWSSVIDREDLSRAGDVCFDLGLHKNSTLEDIRAAYRERLHGTPGVIVADTPFTDVPLTVEEFTIDVGLDEHYARLRTLGQRPDGLDVLPDREERDDRPDRCHDGNIYATARQFARGWFFKADPLPPLWWMAARRDYFAWVRREIEARRAYTELEARRQAEREGLPELTAWNAAQAEFSPRYRHVWLSDAALEACLAWGRAEPGVVWVDHPEFGRELARRGGWRYFGEAGLAACGATIESQNGQQTIVASRRANGVGRNLQYAFHRCLFTDVPTTSDDFEQNVGRFHREGQTIPVRAYLLLACREDYLAARKIQASAARIAESAYGQKAVACEWIKAKLPAGPAWE